MNAAMKNYAKAMSVEAEEPTPLVREIPPGEAYPMHALGPLREPAEAIHDQTQAPPTIGAQAVLGVASLAAQALADAETLHGRAPASLFLLTVAQSGERKSACDRLAMQAVRDFEADLGRAVREETNSYLNAFAVWDAERKRILAMPKKGDAARNGTEMRADLEALGPEPEPPLYPTIVASDSTVEGVTKHMNRLRPSVAISSAEGGSFVGGYGMSAENKLKTSAALSTFWDGGPIDRWRAGDGVQVFLGRRLCMHLMIQPAAVAPLLADPLVNSQGLLGRFLLTEPPSTIGTRLRTGHAPASEAALARFSARIGDLLRQDLPLREGTRNELEPPVLHMTPDARKILQEFALAIEAAQAKGCELEAARPFASKAAEHAARLAAVMAIYSGEGWVTDETMENAVTLAGFYVNEAARLANAATISTETAEAEKLRKWLAETWAEPCISTRAVVRRGPNSLREAKKARAALKMLEGVGALVLLEEGGEVEGVRAREAWRIVRRVGA